jgi:hypothetical protein
LIDRCQALSSTPFTRAGYPMTVIDDRCQAPSSTPLSRAPCHPMTVIEVL